MEKCGYEVLCPRSYELDLCDSNAVNTYFKENKIDFIVHCGSVGGARGVSDKDTTIEDNLSMVENLITCKGEGTRVILFGSGAMYGKDRNLNKISENEVGKYIPKDLYGISKMKIAQFVEKRDDITCLNIFACYGYGEKENRFPSYAIARNLEHSDIVINQNVVFDYLFVEDMQKIVGYFIKNKPEDKIINITPTKSVSLKEIAEAVNEISEFKSAILIKNATMNFEYTGDNTLLLKNIPDFKFTPLKDGLKKLYMHMDNCRCCL